MYIDNSYKKFLYSNLLLILIIFTSFFSVAQVKNDWVQEGLKGKVKLIILSFFLLTLKPGYKHPIYHKEKLQNKQIFLFDENGKLIDISSYSVKGTLMEKLVYVYNEFGKRISKNTFREGNQVFKDSVVYDNNGNICIEATYNMSDSLKNERLLYA